MAKQLKTYDELLKENESLQWQLEEANETIDAIRTGQVDAIVVMGKKGNELYTLKTADQTYRVFIEKMNEGAVTLNEAGIILYSNSTFATMVGMPLSKVIGLSFDSFVSPDYKEIYASLFTNGWIHDSKVEIPITNSDKTIPCQFSVATLALDEGIFLSLILTDLTLQKETQQLLKLNNMRLEEMISALENSNSDLQQFASVASHDLQEPLRKIMIYASMIKERHKVLPSNEIELFLEKIITSSKRLKNLVSDVLSHSRLYSSEQDFVATDLNEIINEIVIDYEILIQEKNAKIIISNLPKAEVNKGQIRQVFQNLISNALKFSKPDVPPVIYIQAKQSAGEDTELYCTISISDNGIGFDEKFNDIIFSLFGRLNTKDKYEGSGIGLAITKKILDKHHGTITAWSKEGVGSEFIITLPLRHIHD